MECHTVYVIMSKIEKHERMGRTHSLFLFQEQARCSSTRKTSRKSVIGCG